MPTTPASERSPLVVVGEALVDIVVPQHGEPLVLPGGSPMNVAVGLARLGHDTTLVTELGDDEQGRLVAAHLEASGVRLGAGSVTPGGHTSRAVAHLDDDGAATYGFDLHWTLGPRTLPEDARALHIGSMGAALRPGRASVLDLVGQAVQAGILVTFDPNSRPALTPDYEQAWADVREVAASAQLVKLSEEDLRFLRPGATGEDLARALLGGPTRLVVVTYGGGGSTAFTGHQVVHVDTVPAKVLDTVGAGDSFMAALVAVVVERGLDDLGVDRLLGYLTAAHQAAAITVSRRGADPPRRDELPAGWPIPSGVGSGRPGSGAWQS